MDNMGLDLRVLKSMLNRRSYDLLHKQVRAELVSAPTMYCLKWIKAYYSTYREAEGLTEDELTAYIKLRNEDKLEDEGVKLMLELVNKMKTVPKPDDSSIYEALLEVSYAGKSAKLIMEYQTGGEIDLLTEMDELTREFTALRRTDAKEDRCILDILDDIDNDVGIQFEGVKIFEEYSKPFGEGESIAIAGDQGMGKTTLLSFLIPKAVKSIVRKYGGTDRPILWLVNEGNTGKIKPRLFQGAMGCTMSELMEMRKAGTLIQEYEKAIGAPHDFIKVLPFHGKTITDLHILAQEYNPSMVVVDMAEHVGGVKGEKKDIQIGNIWVKLRESALMYGYVSVATIQISEEGKNNLFPAKQHLSWSKSAVQGATDCILMMGNIDAEGRECDRGLSLAKMKSKIEGVTAYPKIEYVVDFDRCKFEELYIHK